MGGKIMRKSTVTQKILAITLIFGSLFMVAMDFPGDGTDLNAYRCSGRLASVGDSLQEVIETCGEPIDEIKIDPHPHRILVYRFEKSQSRFVYYFSFLRNRLTRIVKVDCTKDVPHCE